MKFDYVKLDFQLGFEVEDGGQSSSRDHDPADPRLAGELEEGIERGELLGGRGEFVGGVLEGYWVGRRGRLLVVVRLWWRVMR